MSHFEEAFSAVPAAVLVIIHTRPYSSAAIWLKFAKKRATPAIYPAVETPVPILNTVKTASQ